MVTPYFATGATSSLSRWFAKLTAPPLADGCGLLAGCPPLTSLQVIGPITCCAILHYVLIDAQ